MRFDSPTSGIIVLQRVRRIENFCALSNFTQAKLVASHSGRYPTQESRLYVATLLLALKGISTLHSTTEPKHDIVTGISHP